MDYILDKTVSNPDLDVNPDYILKKIASFYRLNFSSADFLSHERGGGLLMGMGQRRDCDPQTIFSESRRCCLRAMVQRCNCEQRAGVRWVVMPPLVGLPLLLVSRDAKVQV